MGAFWIVLFVAVLLVAVRFTSRAARKQKRIDRRGVSFQAGLAPRMSSQPVAKTAATRVVLPSGSGSYASLYPPPGQAMAVPQPTPAATAAPRRRPQPQGRRTPARRPAKTPSEGSTAISSTSLNTTLAMPYQPTSLTSSLSSSLTTSLFDTPPQMAPLSVFGQVAAVSLPPEVEDQITLLIRSGKEVEAVRIVIDEMDVGILEATKTVRSYGDRPAR